MQNTDLIGRQMVIEMLKNYENQKMFCANIDDRKGYIKLKVATGYDKKLAASELRDIEKQKKRALAGIKLLEAGMRTLTEEERIAVNEFYINRSENHIDRLCERLSCEERQTYKYKERALKKICSIILGYYNDN